MGFLELLTIAFVIAKLASWVDWSWFWVFSPMILGYGAAALFFLGYGIVYWTLANRNL